MATITANKKTGIVVNYRARALIGYDAQMKQIRRTTTFPRPEGLTPAKERKYVQQQADAWEEQQKILYAQQQANIPAVDKSQITLAEFVHEHWWPDHVLDGEHTPRSVYFFEYTSANVLEYFGSQRKLREIDAEMVKRYVKWLRTVAKSKYGRPYSAATIQHHFGTLRNILQYAERFDYIERNPTQRLSPKEKPHRQHKGVDFLQPEQAQQFLHCLESEPLYWRCLMNLLITTGMRRGEAVGLRWADLDGDKLTITVQRNVTLDKNAPDHLHIGATKTKEKRTVPISPRVYALLQTYRAEQAGIYGTLLPTAYIFNAPADAYKPLYPTEPTKWQARFVRKNNLPNVSPHDLRHTAATLALESGASLKQVQTLLGHKDPSTTMEFYTGVSEKAQRDTVVGIEQLLQASTTG